MSGNCVNSRAHDGTTLDADAAYDKIPLIGPAFASFSGSVDFCAYLRSLYDETAGQKGRKKEPPKEVSVTVKEGAVKIIRVRRKPKYAYVSELEQIAKEHELDYKLVWTAFTDKKRKIEIRTKTKGDSYVSYKSWKTAGAATKKKK